MFATSEIHHLKTESESPSLADRNCPIDLSLMDKWLARLLPQFWSVKSYQLGLTKVVASQ